MLGEAGFEGAEVGEFLLALGGAGGPGLTGFGLFGDLVDEVGGGDHFLEVAADVLDLVAGLDPVEGIVDAGFDLLDGVLLNPLTDGGGDDPLPYPLEETVDLTVLGGIVVEGELGGDVFEFDDGVFVDGEGHGGDLAAGLDGLEVEADVGVVVDVALGLVEDLLFEGAEERVEVFDFLGAVFLEGDLGGADHLLELHELDGSLFAIDEAAEDLVEAEGVGVGEPEDIFKVVGGVLFEFEQVGFELGGELDLDERVGLTLDLFLGDGEDTGVDLVDIAVVQGFGKSDGAVAE